MYQLGGVYLPLSIIYYTEVQALMFVTPPVLAGIVLYGQNDLVGGRTGAV